MTSDIKIMAVVHRVYYADTRWCYRGDEITRKEKRSSQKRHCGPE